jgi:7-cyano-7-deazaguanine synthase
MVITFDLETVKLSPGLVTPVKTKAVLLLSGGLDSSVLLYYLLDEGFEVYPLTIIYGQRHKKESTSAGEVAHVAGVVNNWRLMKLPQLASILPSALTTVGSKIPEGHYEDDSMKLTVVPNRNMILLGIAAGWAQGLQAKVLAYAPHKGDHVIYPDCRPEFIEAVESAIKLGTGWNNDGVQLLTPFSNMTKADLVTLGTQLGVPFEKTWSCYNGRTLHCGKCGTCVERKEAFLLAGIKDPTKYEEG